MSGEAGQSVDDGASVCGGGIAAQGAALDAMEDRAEPKQIEHDIEVEVRDPLASGLATVRSDIVGQTALAWPAIARATIARLAANPTPRRCIRLVIDLNITTFP